MLPLVVGWELEQMEQAEQVEFYLYMGLVDYLIDGWDYVDGLAEYILILWKGFVFVVCELWSDYGWEIGAEQTIRVKIGGNNLNDCERETRRIWIWFCLEYICNVMQ